MAIRVWFTNPRAWAAFCGGVGNVKSVSDFTRIVSSPSSAKVLGTSALGAAAGSPSGLGSLPSPLPGGLLQVSSGQSSSACNREPHILHGVNAPGGFGEELEEEDELDELLELGDPGGGADAPTPPRLNAGTCGAWAGAVCVGAPAAAPVGAAAFPWPGMVA